ncbi:hypothetical protein OG874_41330 [Nocardia sp. NBC_00565]|uniref:hypothetical protein n=1 Tax=Nocardia sp. NBC_00565 TaxID=2975993 RepID=UPI002E7FE9B2|nr:hypothetical protein [Nocardia sp. NBC_00565]WUC08354.1 hypothetical protein OG874_41330 [Nocardia sp. NBC_00565]
MGGIDTAAGGGVADGVGAAAVVVVVVAVDVVVFGAVLDATAAVVSPGPVGGDAHPPSRSTKVPARPTLVTRSA